MSNDIAGLFRVPKLDKRELTQAILKEYVVYVPDTGSFTLIKSNSPRYRNSLPAKFGSMNADGYLYGMLEGKSYSLHKLAVLYMTGAFPDSRLFRVDHRDRDTANNRWLNLRVIALGENIRNQSQTKTTTKSGHTGVSYKDGAKSPWKAHIRVDGKLKHLGSYATLEEAVAVRQAALSEHLKSVKLD